MSPRQLAAVDFRSLLGDPSAQAAPTGVVPAAAAIAATTQISKTYPAQSYCDSTLLHRAIRTQSPNEPIVRDTLAEYQGIGFAVGLHPSSQTPVAIEFAGGGRSGSSIYTLVPGQVIRPTGLMPQNRGGFTSFKYGLPFGWLGGGVATLLVFQTPDAAANWTVNTEIAFHWQRVKILAPGALPTVAGISDMNWPNNWPTRFPATLTTRAAGGVAYPQKGAPQIAIARPGTTLLRLNKRLAAPATMRAIAYRLSDLDRADEGLTRLRVSSVDIIWPQLDDLGLSADYEETTPIIAPEVLARFACDDTQDGGVSGVAFISNDTELQNQYVDVERRGYL